MERSLLLLVTGVLSLPPSHRLSPLKMGTETPGPSGVLATYRHSQTSAGAAASISSQIRAEDALILLVADVQDDLRRRSQSSTVTKPPDWRTAVCARDAPYKRLH